MSDSADGSVCARWDIPNIDELASVDGMDGSGVGDRQRGYQEGFAQGQLDALAANRQALQAQVDRLQSLMKSLTEPFSELDQDVEAALLSLAVLVAGQMVRREIATDPEIILNIIREAVASLPIAARKVRLQLNPEDARLVVEHMSSPVDEGLWQIIEDTGISRGSCIVKTENSSIDATLEQRLEQIAETVLGEVMDGGA